MSNTQEAISELVRNHKVVLFMKGNKHFPQCGFSATVVSLLGELGVSYEAKNVLTDPELREGIKVYSEWPTIPQLYVDGEFVGGCDIVRDMHASGELAKLLGVEHAVPKAPTITITDAAARAFSEAECDEGDVLKLEIAPNFAVDLFFAPAEKGDYEVKANGITLAVDRQTAPRAEGVTIDYVDGPDGAGFKIDNPQEPPRVKQLDVAELSKMRQRGDAFHLLDVRPEAERARASIDFAVPLDEDAAGALGELDETTTIVVMCHHGVRSQTAAEQLLAEGFKNVFNLRGGIDAWSKVVDTKVPRY